MDRKDYTLKVEPQGELYSKILDLALEECKFVLLVVRKSLPLSEHGATVLNNLNKYMMSSVESMEWPGTQLLDETASVFRYEFSTACAEILKNSAKALYDWTQPELPEDLCLLRNDENPWLVSISHERDSYFYLSENEKNRLLNIIPSMATLLE
jgi:hypothetical protein